MLKKKMLTDKSGLLYEEIMEQAAKRLAADIDAEVMRQTFLESGWHEVVLAPMTWETGDMIDIWVNRHIKDTHWNHGLVWMFKDQKEANWFTLRWLGSQQ